MMGIMCRSITDWMWRVRVLLSWLRMVWLRDEGDVGWGAELYAEYAGGDASVFSFGDMFSFVVLSSTEGFLSSCGVLC